MAKIYWLPKRWLPISIAISGSDLEVCVLDENQAHVLMFPCRRKGANWVDAATKKGLEIQPTHWRVWSEDRPS